MLPKKARIRVAGKDHLAVFPTTNQTGPKGKVEFSILLGGPVATNTMIFEKWSDLALVLRDDLARGNRRFGRIQWRENQETKANHGKANKALQTKGIRVHPSDPSVGENLIG